ncbi:MAG: DUF1572 family protein [Acidobacteria bacterium]|nr:DUF1572 family protein [Acidobacteriota bacterium]
MRDSIEAIEAEYLKYKSLGEAAIAQLEDGELSLPGPNDSNSIAVVVWHVSGNLVSRFTDFLTADGEKAWRDRDDEFVARTVTRQELLEKWNGGWGTLLAALETLRDEDFSRHVAIRGQSLRVDAALYRSLAHTAHHVGQIVYLAKSFRGEAWRTLSIPKGQSQAFNARLSR